MNLKKEIGYKTNYFDIPISQKKSKVSILISILLFLSKKIGGKE